MRLRNAILVPLAMLAALTWAQETPPKPTLKVGDHAPALSVAKWVKGDPVKGFDKDKMYVVEFWATWCGPCKESIPHLTELAKKYPDVTFVGVSVFENDQKEVEPFVKEMGDKMEYRVAMDKLPNAKATSENGAMAKNWMIAAGQGGIPTAFIVDKTGTIAWIGSPFDMDDPLAQVFEGKWDLKAHAEEARLQQDADMRMPGFEKRFADAAKANRDDDALKVTDDMIADRNPKIQASGTMIRFVYLLGKVKDYDKAYAFARTAIDGVLNRNSDYLNDLAWMIVDPKSHPEKQDLDVAMAAAQRSVDLDRNSANVDTLARVYFSKGDKDKAIELQKEAISLTKDDKEKEELEQTLKEYEGA